MQIHNRAIGADQPPFVIAEMSGNHNQSLERALEIVEAAARSGAHALKIQTYTAETMTLDLGHGDFVINDPKSLWHGTTLFKLYQQAYTPWEWHAPIFARAREMGMVPFSTPFDDSAVDFLESLDVACYKIASFENTDLPLIRRAAATGKPMIISTGMATLKELQEAVAAAREGGCRDLVLLKFTSSYPASPSSSNLLMIEDLRRRFGCEVGISDHTMGVGVAVAAVALGATVIEKHFTLRRADGGVDSAFSMEPEEMRQLVTESERAWLAKGEIRYGLSGTESIAYRRSIYFARDLPAGAIIGPDDIRRIRPGKGLAPKHFDEIIGRRLKQAVSRGTATAWNLFEPLQA